MYLICIFVFTSVEAINNVRNSMYLQMVKKVDFSFFLSVFLSDAPYDKACRADFLSLTCFCTKEYEGFIPAVAQTHKGLRVSSL